MKKPIVLSKSIVNFLNNYLKGKQFDAFFKIPPKSRNLQLHFDNEGRLTSLTLVYEGRLGSTMTTDYSFAEITQIAEENS